ncbi:hypothetical protein Leucomu_13530 [Leucobacter muris]|uniref:Uncharacterized protein n=1 Tax=Leucobacter muris TaxID=1935379 RepID=A0ABX5QI84_9MICO|nr:hypothetical protein [Leucobacter muris]QAB18794.1 hypothetical protein Leucomu_13530 [Leucobacter muris]
MALIEFVDPVLGTVQMPDHADRGWGFKSLEGWFDLSSDKTERRERPTAHGSFRARRSLRSSLGITVEAHFLATSPAELVAEQDRIGALGADAPILMLVTDHVRTTEREVRVIDVDVPSYRGRKHNLITIELSADDPRRYSVGDEWVSARLREDASGGLTWPARWPLVWGTGSGSDGRLTLTNHGQKASAPSYRLYGGFSAAEMVRIDTQQRVGIDLIVPYGSYVEIDFRTRRAMLDGQSDVSRYLTWRQWWTVEAGEQVTVQAEYDAPGVGAYYAGRVRSAW